MIIKERDRTEHPETDKWSWAGGKAEEQMAFYLRRAFREDKNIYVLNDLRLKDNTGDAARMDHVIIHRYGFVVIESGSICAETHINKRNEWTRNWNEISENMPSPVEQAKQQVEFLRRALDAGAELMAGRVPGLFQARFADCPFEIIVAVSDQGSIKREIDLPEVVKADQVPDRIREICKRHRLAQKTLGLPGASRSKDGACYFNDEEILRMANFLKEHHFPLHQGTSASVREPPPLSKARLPAKKSPGLGACDECGHQCHILCSRYDFYWKCAKCGNKMLIKEYCPKCGKKLLLRKKQNAFFIYCEFCGGERTYCEFAGE